MPIQTNVKVSASIRRYCLISAHNRHYIMFLNVNLRWSGRVLLALSAITFLAACELTARLAGPTPVPSTTATTPSATAIAAQAITFVSRFEDGRSNFSVVNSDGHKLSTALVQLASDSYSLWSPSGRYVITSEGSIRNDDYRYLIIEVGSNKEAKCLTCGFKSDWAI